MKIKIEVCDSIPPLCKYYNPHMETLLWYCKCLYKLKNCAAGGMLHILLDDNNIDTDDILFCLNECITHPEKEESELGILICKEYLKLSFEERLFFDSIWNGMPKECMEMTECKNCPRMEHV